MRRARVATTLVFFATGWIYAAWATRIPAIKDELDLSSGELGLAVLEGGAVIGLPLGGALAARWGSRRALRVGFAILPGALFATTLVPGPGLALALGVMAAATSVVDVAMNAQGVELERRYERPIMSRPHAGHPLGLALGGLAFCAFLLDGAAFNWSAVHMGEERGASAGLAAAAFTVFAFAIAAGRPAPRSRRSPRSATSARSPARR